MKLSTIEPTVDLDTLKQQSALLQQRYSELFGAATLEEDSGLRQAVEQLKAALLQHKTTHYDSIDRIMRGLASAHRIDVHDLHDHFVQSQGVNPDQWIAAQLSQ